jgi:CPA1 family monovalent cation:H+ antiporter
VSLALALVVMEAPGVTPEVRDFIGALATGFVLFTLLVQATTMRPFMGILGLTKMPEADQALRDRSLSSALRSVEKELAEVASFNEVRKAESDEVVAHYRGTIEAAEKSARSKAVSVDEWKRIGLAMALAQERQIYLTRFGDGYLTSRQLSVALSRVDYLSDTLKEGGNWTKAVEAGVAFHQAIREAIFMQRRFGIVFLLAEALAMRFGVLNVTHSVLKEQRDKGLAEIEALIPPEARSSFRALYEQRYRSISEALSALALQYPDYAAALSKRHLTLAGLRLEEAAYERLRDQAVIGPEIFNVLIRRVTDAEAGAEKLPPLKLKMDPLALISKVPFFSNLSRERQQAIAEMLRTRFVAPGDIFIRRGEIGQEMFFIASGAVKVHVPNGDVSLGTGDFVGELALITNRVRNADVEALGFCTLLALHQRDFKAFLQRNPDLHERIRQVARERLGDDAQSILEGERTSSLERVE